MIVLQQSICFVVDAWLLALSSVNYKLISDIRAVAWPGQDELETNITGACDLHFVCYLQRGVK